METTEPSLEMLTEARLGVSARSVSGIDSESAASVAGADSGSVSVGSASSG